MVLPALHLQPAATSLPEVSLPYTFRTAADLRGAWRITGVAGSGKTSIIAQTVVRALELGVPATEIVVLTPTKEAAGMLNQQIAQRLQGTHFIGEANFAYSIHALAFALLRHCIQQNPDLPFDPDIRLISGPEQDVFIRQLLLEIAADPEAKAQWPAEVQDALTYAGFARALRDFMLRAHERGVGASALAAIAAEYDEPLWAAIATFMQQYAEIVALAGSENMSASELVSTVVDLPLPQLPWQVVLVDDAQHYDPKSAELINMLRAQAQFSVVCGDPEQTIFQFRGAYSQWFSALECDHDVELLHSHRIATISRKIAPNTQRHDAALADILRRTHLRDQVPWHDMAVIVRSSASIPALRRQLLAAGIPVYTDGTAIVLAQEPIVRELLATIDADHAVHAYVQGWLQRPLNGNAAGLADAGEEASSTAADPATMPEPAAGAGQATDAAAQLHRLRVQAYARMRGLVEGQLLMLEPLGWQRLERTLRRIAHTLGFPIQDAGTDVALDALCVLLDTADLAQATASGDTDVAWKALPDYPVATSRSELAQHLASAVQRCVSAQQLRDLQRMQAIMRAPRRAVGVEQILWQIWQHAGIARKLQNLSIQGGAIGSQADRTLDAVMALFDIAANWVERRPGGSIQSFQRYLQEQELPAGVRDRASAQRAAVRLITAHGVSGQEWHTVVVAEVQEQVWPLLDPAGTLLKQEEFTDYIDRGITPGTYIARTTEQLQAERNLFHVALTRATDQVVVLAVEDTAAQVPQLPSRFLQHLHPVEVEQTELGTIEYLEQHEADIQSSALTADAAGITDLRVLSASHVVAELRRVLATTDQQPVRQQALRQLMRLAQAGVPGADPQQWWGKPPTSATGVQKNSLSPSAIERAWLCPLRGVLEACIPTAVALPMTQGKIVHLVAEAVTAGLPHNAVVAAASQAFARCLQLPPWWQQQRLQAFRQLLRNLVVWLQNNAADTVLSEVPVQVDVTPAASRPLHITGRLDRLAVQQDGYEITDFKTSKQVPSKKDAAANLQLRTYQLALAHGQLRGGEVQTRNADTPAWQSQGAQLVYPAVQQARGGVATRVQPPLLAAEQDELRQQLLQLREDLEQPTLRALANTECQRCALRRLCPAQEQGATILS